MGRTLTKPGPKAATILNEIDRILKDAYARTQSKRWPAEQWQDDPVGFVREILGGSPLPHQEEILKSLVARGSRVAVRSGTKTGKTLTIAWAAIWFYCCFPKCRVVVTATEMDQIKKVVWGAIQECVFDAREKTGFEIEPLAANPATGVVSADRRTIYAVTTRDKEGWQGISSPNLLIIADEATHLTPDNWEALEGNFTGGGRCLLIGNPVRTEGPFYDAFHVHADMWHKFHLDSEKVAQWCLARKLEIPGVANMTDVNNWITKYGRASPFYIQRVLGDFVVNETGRIFSLEAITLSQARYSDDSLGGGTGVLSVGVDPAGPGDEGDEYAFTVVRGHRVLLVHTVRGLTEEAAIALLRGFFQQYRAPGEIPQVIVDSEGQIGSSLYYRLKGMSESLRYKRPDIMFESYAVKASAPATREPMVYDRRREELWASGAKWVREGGAIPPDHKLEAELHAAMWEGLPNGKLKVTPKKTLRERLGRSPDRADSLLLAVWQPVYASERTREAPTPDDDIPVGAVYEGVPMGVVDPYAGSIDPYG